MARLICATERGVLPKGGSLMVDIEMRGPTIGIVIVDHLAMDMHQTARWAMLMDHAVDGHEAGRHLLQSTAMLQIEVSGI